METFAPRSLEAESEMLPQDPPPQIIRLIAWWLIGLFVVALFAGIAIHFPESETAPFVLVPREGADPIQSPRLSTVNRVSVSEGETVKAGAELFVLRSDEIRDWDTQERTLTEDLRTHELTLTKMDEAYAAEADIKSAQVAQADSQLRFCEKQASSNRDLLNRMEKLSKNGGFSQVDLIRLRMESAGADKDQAVAQRTLEQVKLERQELENEHTRKRAEEAGEVEKLKVKLAALKSGLENSQRNLLTVRAPYDAVVISLAQRSAGSVVQSGAELCQLARADAKPLARLTLNESSLAKLKVGEPVRFFFEAFPYQRYGAVAGTLDWISPSAVTAPDGRHFVALASIDHNANHRHLALKAGMRGEARIRVGSRTLIEYAFEPLRQLHEGVRD
ncbi:MAG: HlyD family efflux transporter periplasmic adaptor subunit [Verrucomicrobia bacterium]|nr:HlyD family efflux transporter periplasmic adaptor subunit [Verrucomicrobiota bacterium]